MITLSKNNIPTTVEIFYGPRTSVFSEINYTLWCDTRDHLVTMYLYFQLLRNIYDNSKKTQN